MESQGTTIARIGVGDIHEGDSTKTGFDYRGTEDGSNGTWEHQVAGHRGGC